MRQLETIIIVIKNNASVKNKKNMNRDDRIEVL